MPSISLLRYEGRGLPLPIETLSVSLPDKGTKFLSDENPRHLLWMASASPSVRCLDTLMCVKSAPRSDFIPNAANLCASLESPISRTLSLGDDCTSIIDAILYAAYLKTSVAGDVLLAVEDRFGQLVDRQTLTQKPDTLDWRDASSRALLSAYPEHNLRIISCASAFAPQFGEMVKIEADPPGFYFRFDHSFSENFKLIDLGTEVRTIKAALCGRDPNRVKLVVTNRTPARTELLKDALGIEASCMYASRSRIGHTGGSDILFNLKEALADKTRPNWDILISANGIGYSWKAMLISVDGRFF